MAKGFYHRNTSDILYRFIGHIIQRILVFLHLLLHFLSCHRHHNEKAQKYRRQAQKTQSPVKHKQQNQKTAGGCEGVRTVRELVRQIGFRSGAGFIDDFAQLTAAKMFRKSQGEFYDMVHGLQTQIGGNTESAQMGAHQPGDVHQYRNDRKHHCHPAVVGQILRTAEIRSDFQHFTHDLPDKIIRHECDQCADCGEDPGRIGQISVTSRNREQAR